MVVVLVRMLFRVNNYLGCTLVTKTEDSSFKNFHSLSENGILEVLLYWDRGLGLEVP